LQDPITPSPSAHQIKLHDQTKYAVLIHLCICLK
jgi:hypothetical protein